MLFAVVVMNMVRTWRPNSAQPLTLYTLAVAHPPASLDPSSSHCSSPSPSTISSPSVHPHYTSRPTLHPTPTTPHQPQVYLTSETRVRIDEPGINDPPIKLLVTGLNFFILYMLQVP